MTRASGDDFADHRWARLAAAGDAERFITETCTSPSLSPDGTTLAYVSDRDGWPRLWLTPLPPAGEPGYAEDLAVAVDTGPDHVRSVRWSPDGEWLCAQVAPGGGERSRVLALRPDGTALRVLAGAGGFAATLGAWRPIGHEVGVVEAGGPEGCTAFLVDAATGQRRRLAGGPAALVCAVSGDGRYAAVRVGTRGRRQLVLVDLSSGQQTPLLADAAATVADARFSADCRTLYLHTDGGRELPALLAVAVPAPRPGVIEVVAQRPDAELEGFALDAVGCTAALVWNVGGRSEVELIDLGTGDRHTLPDPGNVVTGLLFARDGGSLVLVTEGPAQPSHVVRYRIEPFGATRPASPLVPGRPSPWDADELARPSLERFLAADGLVLSGWLYRPRGALGPVPTVVFLHGGPEAQERPTFNPLYQELVANGLSVFAPNVRGSTGFGRSFANADNHEQRFDAIGDVAAAAEFLLGSGLADPSGIACAGRSYGGYLTLAALVSYPELFRAGVDICGIANFETFFRNTEPWIAAAATSKYGDPSHDSLLLRELSPIHRIDRLTAPLLVVHGAQDTNVPLVEAEQVVAALREHGALPRFLLFDDEGHEIQGTANRARFVREVVDWLVGHLCDLGEQTA